MLFSILISLSSDDQYVNQSNSSILINNDKLNDTNDSQIETPLSEVCFYLLFFKENR